MPAMHKEDYSLCSGTDVVNELGSGIPLFYRFHRRLMVFYVIMILIVSIYSVATNYSQGKGKQWVEGNIDVPLFIKLSLGNHGKYES